MQIWNINFRESVCERTNNNMSRIPQFRLTSIFYRRVLEAKTAGTNDYFELELPRIRQPECSSKSSKPSLGTKTMHSFPI